jgi:nucleotide-binding universal stress UspA family protein/GNAT superfamily N-acetyltransferase
VAGFERLSEESRYRRFFTAKTELSAAEVDYLVNVDHSDHEAIIAIDPSGGEALGIARYVRSSAAADVAEVAVSVADDWQGRGLGRALLDRLTYRARREGVRRFSARVQSDNEASLGLAAGVGAIEGRADTGEVDLVIELPPKRGMGARLSRALQAAAGGRLLPAQTLVYRAALDVEASPRTPVRPTHQIRTIVVGVDGSETASGALAIALRLSAVFGSALHLVSAYGAGQAPGDAEAVLAEAMRAARVEGVEPVPRARRDDPAMALIAVVEERDADLLVVGSRGTSRAPKSPLGSVSDNVARHAPCSVLIVRTDSVEAPGYAGPHSPRLSATSAVN